MGHKNTKKEIEYPSTLSSIYKADIINRFHFSYKIPFEHIYLSEGNLLSYPYRDFDIFLQSVRSDERFMKSVRFREQNNSRQTIRHREKIFSPENSAKKLKEKHEIWLYNFPNFTHQQRRNNSFTLGLVYGDIYFSFFNTEINRNTMNIFIDREYNFYFIDPVMNIPIKPTKNSEFYMVII